MVYKFSDFIRISNNMNQVIVSNIKTGISTKITQECYDILEQWLALGLEECEFFNAFEDAEDRRYFEDLLKILKDNQLIVARDLKEEWEIKSVNVEVTHRCNLFCKHCAVSAGTIQDPEYISTEKLIELFNRVIQMNPIEIVITGGEPLVRTDFLDVLDYLKRNYEGILTLMTNATLITKDNIKQYIPYFNSWNISIDGVNESTCACIRGSGVFEKVISTIKLLKSEGVKNISLSMVETSENQEYIEDFFSLCKKLDVFPMLREYTEEGRGKTNSKKLKPIEKKKSIQEAFEEAQEIGNSKIEREACYHCGAGQNEFHIDYKGDLYPCGPLTYPEFKICNVLEQPDFSQYILSGAYKTSEGYKNISFYTPDNLPKCKDCPNKLFCWGCLYDIQLIYKSTETFEKWCKYSKLELMHLWK